MCCAGSTAGLIPGKHENPYHLPLHLLIVAGVFALAYAAFFKEKILERINREILMVWTLAGLYIAFETPAIASNPHLWLPTVVLSLVAIVNAFACFDNSYGWRAYFYVWFLCIMVGVMASRFAFSAISSIFGLYRSPDEINPLMIFVIGMSFLYLAVNLWYVIELIPIPGKHQSLSERLEQVEEDLNILAGDYDVEPVRRWKTLLLFVLCTSLLALNHFWHVVSEIVIISLLIGVLPVLHRFNFSQGQVTSDSSSSGIEGTG